MMMAFGITGMVAHLFMRLRFGYIDAYDWMLFAIYGVVAICGAIKEVR